MTNYAPDIHSYATVDKTTESSKPKRAVVFIHGILSSHMTFKAAHRYFERVSRHHSENLELTYFDYDYKRELVVNGAALAAALLRRYSDGSTQVTLVCHSMGGLIARLAVLLNGPPLQFVSHLFLLGTPNRGAFHTRQLSSLFASVMESGIPAKAVNRRAPGILQLTQAYSIIDEFRGSSSRADHITYVTIPGCFFHENRALLSRGNNPNKVFWVINLLAAFSEQTPLSVRLLKPHDGVVERRSNSFIPCDSGRWSEKDSSINFKGNPAPTYAHVQHRICDELTHGTIQSSRRLLSIIWKIMHAESLDVWHKKLKKNERSNILYWTE